MAENSFREFVKEIGVDEFVREKLCTFNELKLLTLSEVWELVKLLRIRDANVEKGRKMAKEWIQKQTNKTPKTE